MTTITTIGVYEFDASRFLQVLHDASVTQVIDVRQRRGVRGPAYAWANCRWLQNLLRDEGIAYRHLRSLAPTTELRQLQYAADARTGVGKRSRRALDDEYISRYGREIMSAPSLIELVDGLPSAGRAALFCVERDPEACHRSLIAAQLATHHGLTVQHLRPARPGNALTRRPLVDDVGERVDLARDRAFRSVDRVPLARPVLEAADHLFHGHPEAGQLERRLGATVAAGRPAVDHDGDARAELSHPSGDLVPRYVQRPRRMPLIERGLPAHIDEVKHLTGFACGPHVGGIRLDGELRGIVGRCGHRVGKGSECRVAHAAADAVVGTASCAVCSVSALM